MKTRRLAAVLLLFVTACTGESVAETTTTVAVTTTTAYKLPPIDESLDADETKHVESLRFWSIAQDEATTIDVATDQEIADFGNSICDGIETVGNENILDFYDRLGAEMEVQGFKTDSYAAMFNRAIFILCPEFRDATAAILEEN